MFSFLLYPVAASFVVKTLDWLAHLKTAWTINIIHYKNRYVSKALQTLIEDTIPPPLTRRNLLRMIQINESFLQDISIKKPGTSY